MSYQQIFHISKQLYELFHDQERNIIEHDNLAETNLDF